MTRKKRILRSLVVDEVSGVDKAAQVPAAAVLRKRAESIGKGHDFDRPALTSENEGHQHMIEDVGMGGETSWTRSEGTEQGHSHPWVRDLDGSITIGVSDGHTHSLSSTSTVVVGASKSAGGAGGGQPQGDPPMTNKTPETATDVQIPESVTKSIADLTSRAERAEAIMKMSADERGVFDALDGDGQTAFLAKSATERAADVADAQAADKVMYKSASGEVFRASDDPRLIKMAREADESREATRVALEKAENARLEKRADEELGHCPGTTTQRASILKALEGVDGAAEFLKAADASLAKSFVPSGTSAPGEELLKAEDKLEALAKAHVEANPGVSIEKARATVLETPEGSALYALMG